MRPEVLFTSYTTQEKEKGQAKRLNILVRTPQTTPLSFFSLTEEE